MNLTYTPREQAFRVDCRRWLAEHVPTERLPSGDTREGFVRHLDWERQLYEAGYAAVSWPEEYGGRGAPRKCTKGTSIPDYTAVWAGLPPKSPVEGVQAPLVDVVLLPMGATDLRVAEFPTTAA